MAGSNMDTKMIVGKKERKKNKTNALGTDCMGGREPNKKQPTNHCEVCLVTRNKELKFKTLGVLILTILELSLPSPSTHPLTHPLIHRLTYLATT